MEGAESRVAAYNSNSNQDIQRKFGTVKNNLQGRSQTQNLGGAFFFCFFFLEKQNYRSLFFLILWKLIGCSLDQVEGYTTPVVKVIFRKLA